jgi:hypothetical protein
MLVKYYSPLLHDTCVYQLPDHGFITGQIANFIIDCTILLNRLNCSYIAVIADSDVSSSQLSIIVDEPPCLVNGQVIE